MGYIQAGSTNLDVGYRAAPHVVDWNNDGKKDLVIGNDHGLVKLFLNTGTNASPVFNNYTNLMVGSTVINLNRSSPKVCDLDRDGKKDLIVGDWQGYFHFYHNSGSDENPVFTSSDTLMRNSNPPWYIYVNQSAKFDLADWDEDGDMDIISGDWYAFINYFENVSPPFTIDEDLDEFPADFYLDQNYPNPFNPSTTISYTIPYRLPVNISVYNITGQLVTTLVNEQKEAGLHSIRWDARGLISGVYFYRVTAGDFAEVKKCILLK